MEIIWSKLELSEQDIFLSVKICQDLSSWNHFALSNKDIFKFSQIKRIFVLNKI